MDLGLTGRVAVVTAASKDLGRATALAAQGAKVVLNARDAAALAAVAAQIEHAVVVPGDITDPRLPAQLVEAAVDRWGRLDVVVGNAGGPPTGRVLDVTDEQILAAVNANMLASVRSPAPPCPTCTHTDLPRGVVHTTKIECEGAPAAASGRRSDRIRDQSLLFAHGTR